MSDPYYLRKANIDDLDLSKYEKDYKPEELAAVKEALNAEKQKHEEQFNNLPFAQRAKYHAADVIDYAQQNPEAFLGIPAAAVLFGAGKVAAEKGSETAKKVHGSLRDFMSSKTADEGLLATQQAEKKVNPTVATPEQTIAPQPVQTAEKIIASAKPELPVGVTAETEVGKAPKDIGLVERSEQNKLSKEVAAAAPKGSAPAPESKVKKPAIPTFKTPSDIPEGMVFRPDVGNLDRGLVNILGPEGRLYAKDVLNEGKMFGHAGADYNQKVKELVGKYGEELKKITPSIDLTTREGRIAVGAPHTENYGSALGKAAKVGGVLGTLMTVAQSANAREAVGNVAESLLPIGMTPSELQSGKLTARQIKAFEEAQKLGSPYRSVPPPR